MTNPVTFKFECNACNTKVEQGAAPEQVYLEYNQGNETRSVQYQACSKCYRELLPHIRRQEAFDLQQDKLRPPKQFNLDKMRGGVPDSVLERLYDTAEKMPTTFDMPQPPIAVLPQLFEKPPEQTFDRFPPEQMPPPSFQPGQAPLAPPPQNDALAQILAAMVQNQQQMLETQQRTNELLAELKQPKQQQQNNNRNNWRPNNGRNRNNDNRPRRPGP